MKKYRGHSRGPTATFALVEADIVPRPPVSWPAESSPLSRAASFCFSAALPFFYLQTSEFWASRLSSSELKPASDVPSVLRALKLPPWMDRENRVSFKYSFTGKVCLTKLNCYQAMIEPDVTRKKI